MIINISFKNPVKEKIPREILELYFLCQYLVGNYL